jgi:hypothetical protein
MINELTEINKHWSFVNRIGTKGGVYEHSVAAKYLADKYLPISNSILESTLNIRTKIGKINKVLQQVRDANWDRNISHEAKLQRKQEGEANSTEQERRKLLTDSEKLSEDMTNDSITGYKGD